MELTFLCDVREGILCCRTISGAVGLESIEQSRGAPNSFTSCSEIKLDKRPLKTTPVNLIWQQDYDTQRLMLKLKLDWNAASEQFYHETENSDFTSSPLNFSTPLPYIHWIKIKKQFILFVTIPIFFLYVQISLPPVEVLHRKLKSQLDLFTDSPVKDKKIITN